MKRKLFKRGKNGSVEARFNEKWVLDKDGCHIWIASVRSGYGRFTFHSRSYGAHRISWSLTNGSVPTGMWILHHCDQRLCVNVEHLYVGDSFDNSRDKRVRGRQNDMQLNESQVRKIRASRDTQANLAKRFSVSPRIVQKVVDGSSYKWVTP